MDWLESYSDEQAQADKEDRKQVLEVVAFLQMHANILGEKLACWEAVRDEKLKGAVNPMSYPLRDSPYLNILVSPDRGITVHVVKLDVARLSNKIREAVNERRYRMSRLWTEYQVVVGADVIKSCAIGSVEVDLQDIHYQLLIAGQLIQLIGWVEGVLVIPCQHAKN